MNETSAGAPITSSHPLHRNGEHISDAALGLDHARGAGVAFEFAPEAENLHVDAAIEDILVHASCLQQLLAAERSLRRFEKGEQHRILALGQCHRDAGRIGELPDPAVELPTGKSKAAAFGIARRRPSSYIEPGRERHRLSVLVTLLP